MCLFLNQVCQNDVRNILREALLCTNLVSVLGQRIDCLSNVCKYLENRFDYLSFLHFEYIFRLVFLVDMAVHSVAM